MPSVGCGLPVLLLSVIPPIIPRASWPSSEYGNVSMRPEVTFSSQPKLSKRNSTDLEDYFITSNRQEDAERKCKTGILTRLKNFLGSRSLNNKTLSGFNTGTSSGDDIVSTHLHVDRLGGLISKTKAASETSSCDIDAAPSNQRSLRVDSTRELHPFKHYGVRKDSGSIISAVQQNNSTESINLNGSEERNTSKFSLVTSVSHKEDKSCITTQRKFSYPTFRKCTIQHQHSQPILSFREKFKGSPRFPHKIIPASSVNALEETNRCSQYTAAAICSVNPSGDNIPYSLRHLSHQHHLQTSLRPYEGKCRSLEDATSIYKGAGLSCRTGYWRQRAVSYSPNCDIWEASELGIPLSELANRNKYNVHTSVQRRNPQCTQNQM